MQRQKTQSDFVLFPSQPSDHADMLAFEPSRHQHFYFPQFSMDATFNDPFVFNMESFTFPQNEGPQRAPQSYLDTQSLFMEPVADIHKPMVFPPPSTPPLITTSERHLSSLSSTSGPSIPSASSSAIGSPYSAATHGFQENWVDTNHGLGHPTEVVNDLANDYVGNAADNEQVFGQDKLPGNFVGECDNISSSAKSQSAIYFSNSQFSEHVSVSSFPITSPDGERGMAMGPQNMGSSSLETPTFKSPVSPVSVRTTPSSSYSPGLANRRQSNPDPVINTGMRTARMSPFPFSPKRSKSSMSSPQSPKRGRHGHFQSSFFNQSSGNFVPPLESSCWFFLEIPLHSMQLSSIPSVLKQKKDTILLACTKSLEIQR